MTSKKSCEAHTHTQDATYYELDHSSSLKRERHHMATH